MKKFKLYIFQALIFLIIMILTHSCSNIYYVGETTIPTNIYYTKDTSVRITVTVPVGEKLLVRHRKRKFYRVYYDGYNGYCFNTHFNNLHRFNSLHDGNIYGYSTIKSKSKPITRNSSSSQPSTGGNVHVKGYYRKNGTYVKPYTRRSPSRRK